MDFHSQSLRVLITMGLLIGLVRGIPKLINPNCKTIAPDSVDEDWFDKITSSVGWYNEVSSKVEPNVNVGTNSGKGGNKETCWTVDIKFELGPALGIPLTCKYDELEQQLCDLKTLNTPLATVLKMHGDFTYIKSDNETYFIGYGCLFGKKEFWSILVPKGQKQLSDNTIKELLKFLSSHGIGTEKEDLKSKDDKIQIGKVIPKPDCKEGLLGGVNPGLQGSNDPDGDGLIK